MKSLQILLIGLLSLTGAVHADKGDKLSEDTTKALIIRQLLTLVEWPNDKQDKTSVESYKLCTYRDSQALKNFQHNLNTAEINKKAIRFANQADRNELGSCDVVFIEKPSRSDIKWFIDNKLTERILFIAQGRDYAAQGFHIGLFLNRSNTFEIELNSDVFFRSRMTPNPELMKNSSILQSQVEQKTTLLRTLINYTDWPPDGGEFIRSKMFELCFYRENRLAPFLKYFAKGKGFKGKELATRNISERSEVKDCHAVVINRADGEATALLSERARNKVLFIGDHKSFGSKGVHYNISPGVEVRRSRFEINLMAFSQTGHSPHFELLNSGSLVKKDYPEYTRLLTAIVQQTVWPVITSSTTDSVLDLCVYHDPLLVENLRYFSLPMLRNNLIRKSLSVRNLDRFLDFEGCEVLVTTNGSKLDWTAMAKSESGSGVLLIADNIEDKREQFHFNFKISPKQITFGINLKALKTMGFAVKNELIELGKAVKGSGNGN